MAAVTSAPGHAVHLLDGNVLIALVSPSHVHHAAAERWFTQEAVPFATCPVTQGTLLRILMNIGQLDTGAALAVLHQVTAHPRHRFWPDAVGYAQVSWRGVIGHRQVTDAYLAGLARHFEGRLVSFDRGLGAVHPDVVLVLPAD
ncbi:MAG: TA system VapC family ribonuclease toxin [Rubrivivax sp.]